MITEVSYSTVLVKLCGMLYVVSTTEMSDTLELRNAEVST